MTTQKWPLQIIVGAKDSGASKTLAKIRMAVHSMGAPVRALQGALRLSGVSKSLGFVRDGVIGVGRTFLEAGRKAALFGTLAGGALATLVQRVTGAGDRTNKLARHLNVNAEKFQAWRFAAKDAGVEAAAFEGAMVKLSTSIGEAAAGKGRGREYIEVLRMIGVEFQDAEGKAKSMTTIFPEIADALQKLPDVTARAAFSKALFGEGNFMILDALKDGSAGLEAAEKSARAAGAIVSQEQLDASEGFQQTLHEIGVEISGITTQLVGSMLPTIQKLSTEFKSWLVDNQDRIKWWAEYLGTNIPIAISALWDSSREFWAWLEPKVKWLGDYLGNAADNLNDFGRALGLVENRNADSKRAASLMRSRNARELREREVGIREVAPQAAANGAEISGALTVSFANVPRGARITRNDEARRWTSLDVGYAMTEVGAAFR
jgi:hypothetical protein